jgi:hypothetical protein
VIPSQPVILSGATYPPKAIKLSVTTKSEDNHRWSTIHAVAKLNLLDKTGELFVWLTEKRD